MIDTSGLFCVISVSSSMYHHEAQFGLFACDFFFSHVVPVLSLMAVFILRRLVIRDHLTQACDHSLAVLS